MSAWLSQGFTLVLDVGDVSVPVTAAQLDFAMNAMPTASVPVPLGVDARTSNSSSAVDALAAAGPDTPVTLSCIVKESGAPLVGDLGNPVGTFTLFSGFIAGYGFHRDGRSATLQFAIRHWLSTLDDGSVLSRWSQPTNPVNYAISAILPRGSGAESPKSIYGSLADYNNVITPVNVQKDIWANVVRPFLQAIETQGGGLEIPELSLTIDDAENTAVSAALGLVKSYPTLELVPSAAVDASFTMSDQLGSALANGAIVNHTFWDVIVGRIVPDYGLALVPRILDALIVPYVPTMALAYKTIKASQYYAAELRGDVPRPLRAVGLLGGLGFGSGLDGTPGGIGPPGGIQGWYQDPNRKTGSILIERAPSWAEQLVGVANLNASTAAGGPVATAGDPGAAGKRDAASRQALQGQAQGVAGMLANFAKARYAYEEGRYKQGFIAGPFRLDIAPGSAVAIEIPGLPNLLYATVTHVSCVINATSRTGGTSFQLSHIRTAAENADQAHSLFAHPLYAQPFLGAGLLDTPAPGAGN